MRLAIEMDYLYNYKILNVIDTLLLPLANQEIKSKPLCT